jgi:integrase
MGVERTANGWRCRWTDPWGRRVAKGGFRRKADADAYYKRILGDMARGEYIDPRAGRITVAAWADEWLAGARNLSRGGRETYARDLHRYILPAIGRVPIGRLSATDIDRYLASLTLAPSSAHRHYRTVRRMLEVARQRGMIVRNPAEFVQPPVVPRVERPVLDPLQVDALADAIAPRYRAWVYVMCYGGLRWAEAVGLRRMDVDGAQLRVGSQLVHRGPGEWERKDPKAGSRRPVTLPDFAATELAAHLEEFSLPGPEGLVFPTRNGTPVQSPSFTANVFKRALRKAGLPDVRIHDLRHTAVTLGIEAGINPKVNQSRVGHASSSLHLDTYGHVYAGADGEAAVKLAELRAKALRARLKAV